jgi:sterol desaturase/sphingolipid hydroxylase (fatty acid hydroxylase superfamily)
MHPIENLVSAFRRIFGQSFVFGTFLFLFGPGVNAYDILGINLLSFFANLAISNLRHSPIPISYGRIEKYFLSPAQHLLHHSQQPKLMNSNYGVVLAIWDRIFGSFSPYHGQNYGTNKNQKIIWGLKNPRFQEQSLSQQLFIPITLSFQHLKSLVSRGNMNVIHYCQTKLNKNISQKYEELT